MTKRYRALLILINTLERLSIKYHFVNCTHPSDSDTAIRVGTHPRGDILAATVMAAADVQITE